MSNRLCIEPTKFEDVRTGHVSFGYRIYDDYGSAYGNLWDSIPDDDLDVLRLIMEDRRNNIVLDNLLCQIQEDELTIFIGDSPYNWEQVKEIVT